MIKILDLLFNEDDNVNFVTKVFLEQFGLKFNVSSIKNQLTNHPDYHSLLNIKDFLDHNGFDTLAVKLNPSNLENINIPFIVQTIPDNNRVQNFTVVVPVSSSKFKFIDPNKKKWIYGSWESFTELFACNALFAEFQDIKIFEESIGIRKKSNNVFFSLVIFLIIISLGSILWNNSFLFGLYLFFSFIGVFFSYITILYENDESNPIIDKVCSGSSTKVSSCNEVLKSPGSILLGVNLSKVGFAYFISNSILLFLNNSLYPNLLIFSVLTLPVILYSLYYQAIVLKKWCKICLIIQSVLISQLIISLLNIRELKDFIYYSDVNFIIIAVFFLLMYVFTEKFMLIKKEAKKGEIYRINFQRFKTNDKVVQGLFSLQKKLENPSSDLGVTLGNLSSSNTLIKVCNPFCNPCSRSHKKIMDLLNKNKNLKVQIIFSTSDNLDDLKNKVVQRFLKLNSLGDKTILINALNDWYTSETKDFNVFAEKYPLDYENEFAEETLRMNLWCKNSKIKHTPTYYLNNIELPSIYQIEDLNYILKS